MPKTNITLSSNERKKVEQFLTDTFGEKAPTLTKLFSDNPELEIQITTRLAQLRRAIRSGNVRLIKKYIAEDKKLLDHG